MPEPSEYANHPGVLKIRAMYNLMETRAKRDYPEYFADLSKVGKTAAGTITQEFRQSGLATVGPIMIMEAIRKFGYIYFSSSPVAP